MDWRTTYVTWWENKSKIAIFKGKYTFGLYQLIFGTYLNVLQCVGLHFLSLVSFIPYVSFIKNSKIGPPCRLFHTWLLFFSSFWVLCVFYSIRVVYSGLKSTYLPQHFPRRENIFYFYFISISTGRMRDYNLSYTRPKTK